jgi:para-nitrobenzyl esterase
MHEHAVRAVTSAGTVEGFTCDGVHRWRAIPYAQAPIGKLRYRAPRPVDPWPGVRYCHGFAYCAPQRRRYTLVGVGKYQPMSENCLTLNVTAPESAADGALPVMVFIHGGGYFFGSSATPLYDGAALARKGCVYVSVNYRLGALGGLELSSLSTRDITIDDNLFLRDLVMALQWVHDNIAVFGGDPNNVTIFGESAGAHAVATLLAVPAAKGLFARAISQSPGNGMVRSPEVAAEYASQFAALLGAREGDAAHAAMTAHPADLASALDALILHGQQDMLGAFVTGPTCGTEYLPLHPTQAMRSGKAHRVPLIVGTNADEARLFYRFFKILPMTQPVIDRLLAETHTHERERMAAAYPDYPAQAACIRFAGDFAFGTAVWQIAEAHGRHAPTFVYRYDYAPRTLRWSGLGATHTTELLAVFNTYRTRLGRLLTAAADRASAHRVSDDVQSRWLEFSRSGLPGDDWPAHTDEERAVMIFDYRSRVEYDPHAHRRLAWESSGLAAR